MSAENATGDRPWTPTDLALPDPGVPLEWIAPSGDQVRGKFAGGAVWFPDGAGGMYVYYRPAFWRYAPAEAKRA